MRETWVDVALMRLPDTLACPACGARLASSRCDRCRLDLSAPRAHEVAQASLDAAAALQRRQEAIDVMRSEQPEAAEWIRARERRGAGAAGSAGRATGPTAAPASGGRVPDEAVRPAVGDVPPRAADQADVTPGGTETVGAPAVPSSGAALQPILAGAGAGLLAVATVVFVFFTLADQLALRALVTGGVTAAAVGVAALMRRAGLRSSAEAVAGLAVVLAWVDAELALQAGLLGLLDPVLARAILLLVIAPAFVALGHGLRVRAWAGAGLVVAPAVPVLAAGGITAFFGSAGAAGSGAAAGYWVWTGGLIAFALVAYLARRVAGPVGQRVGRPLRFEDRALRVVRAAGFPGALLVAAGAIFESSGALTSSWTAAILWTVTTALAAGLGHVLRVRSWVTAGVLALPVVPVLAALAFTDVLPGGWVMGAGLLAASLVTLVARVVARVSGERAGARLEVERVLLTLMQVGAFVLALPQAAFVRDVPALPGWGGPAVLFAVAALVAVVLRAVTHHRAWAFSAGVVAAVAAGFLGAVPGTAAAGWFPLAAGLVWALVAAVTTPHALTWLRRPDGRRGIAPQTRADLLLGVWLVVAAGAVPALLFQLAYVLGVVVGALTGYPTWTLDGGPLVGGGLDRLRDVEAWAHVGTAALATVSLVAGRLALPGTLPRVARTTAPWITVGLAIGLVLDPALLSVTSLVLLAVLATLLLALVAEPSAAPRPLRAPFGLARRGVLAAARGTFVLRRVGGRPLLRSEPGVWRAAALTGAFAAIALLLVGSWGWRPGAVAGGAVVAGLLLAARAAVPRALHPWLVGTAYTYALVVLGVWLGWLGLDGVAAVCSVSAAASLAALGVTLWRGVARDEWLAVLGVTSVPFVLGVVTVVTESTWWSAGAAVAMLALELVLLLTARTGLAPAVRVVAAGLVLPTASVAVVTAGAMVLRTSGSPVVLPVVAMLVAVVAGAASRVAESVATRVPDADAHPGRATPPSGGTVWGAALGDRLRGVLEASAVLTGAIAIGLAYLRPAAGPDIAVAVLLVLAAGAAFVAREPDRTRAWWLTAGLVTGATWTALADAGVRLVEAYTLPPALGAVVVGALLARRAEQRDAGGRAWRLVLVGVALALTPSLLVLLSRGEPGDTRTYVLVGAAVAALLGELALRRWPLVSGSWTRWGRAALAGAAALAGTAATLESLHLVEASPDWSRLSSGALFTVGLLWSAVGAGIVLAATVAARRILDVAAAPGGAATARWDDVLRRWGLAPALGLGVLGAVANVRPVWGAIITLWVLEAALLVLLVLTVRRLVVREGGALGAPPWFVWASALAVAIAAWSPRDLRVEVFSVPLGVGLLLAGYLALRPGATQDDHDATGPDDGRRATGVGLPWPLGRDGSWVLLGPGLLALLGPSVLATYTDPLTWRAVLVVVVALAAVLLGSRRRLAAPFHVGVAVLPAEVLVVFLTQLGTQISAVPWMLTLAAAGGVLLIIATLDERRTEGYGGAAAYLRDLR
ncbi:hypothetical protein L1785_06685 [Antribacter sp. KLBMP9083]|uniref:DUF2157 domain-containing protein n=1 Tax=Antribacter soli TaxID=2910976 RepID=A0AA41U640_9MICO|nr:hypothetical protein [Antribacter soli]MCF4120658.1 hypothetical protein [Antribacter soli]